MAKRSPKLTLALVTLATAFISTVAPAQEKGPAGLLVSQFSGNTTASWPYDARLLQTETAADVQAKNRDREVPGAANHPRRIFGNGETDVAWFRKMLDSLRQLARRFGSKVEAPLTPPGGLQLGRIHDKHRASISVGNRCPGLGRTARLLAPSAPAQRCNRVS